MPRICKCFVKHLNPSLLGRRYVQLSARRDSWKSLGSAPSRPLSSALRSGCSHYGCLQTANAIIRHLSLIGRSLRPIKLKSPIPHLAFPHEFTSHLAMAEYRSCQMVVGQILLYAPPPDLA